MVTYLITGAAGFIGSHIVEALAGVSDTEIIAIDNLSTGRTDNIRSFLDRVTFIEGDITHLPFLHKAMAGVDYVIHQAALPSVPRSVSNPEASNENNITGTLNVLVSARDARVKRVVFASSSSVYGADPELPKKENQPTLPKSPYALTKLAGEHYCRIFSELYGLETVSLRYFNVFGPRQDPQSQYAAVIPLFISGILKNEPPIIYGDGTQSRDFTYVDNVVSANLKACHAKAVSGLVFNIGCGRQTTIMELYRMLQSVMKTSIEPVTAAPRPGDVKHSLADISQAETLLGYSPEVSITEGLSRTVSHFISKTR